MSCVRVKMNVFMDDFVVISEFNLFRIVKMSYLISFWSSYRMFCTVHSLKHYCLCFCLLVIDYCSFGNHSCDHHCVRVLNGFYCRCNEGYSLQEDGKTCQCMYDAPDSFYLLKYCLVSWLKMQRELLAGFHNCKK